MSRPYSLLLVDDEPLARQRLQRLLLSHPEFEVVGEAAHGEAALAWLQQRQADVVLLDIQMPGLDGLQTAAALQQTPNPPLIVFCTAYDEHALAAFGVNAIDYVLKPVRPEDLSRALTRVCERLRQAPVSRPSARTHISAHTHKGLELIAVDSVWACVAEQKYVAVLHRDGTTLVDESLKQLEQEFADVFIRVHRGALVAKAKIERLEALAVGGHCLHLAGFNQPIPVSRRQLAEIKSVMKQL